MPIKKSKSRHQYAGATKPKRKSKPKGTVKFGKIQRVDPEEEKQRKRDERTRKQLRMT